MEKLLLRPKLIETDPDFENRLWSVLDHLFLSENSDLVGSSVDLVNPSRCLALLQCPSYSVTSVL